MKYAEMKCKDCGLEFKIVFNNGVPPHISCLSCKSDNTKVIWIDRACMSKELGLV